MNIEILDRCRRAKKGLSARTAWCGPILGLLSLLGGFTACADELSGVRLPSQPFFSIDQATKIAMMQSGVFAASSGPAAPLIFDVGTPRHITGVSFMVGSGSWSITPMKSTLTFEASVDGVTYETIFSNNNREFLRDGTYMDYAVDDAHRGPYRYFRVSARSSYGEYSSLLLCDARAVSEDLAVDGEEPTVWPDRSAVSMPGTNDVTFAAKILSATNGMATVYAAYAKKDYGLSLADWQTKGTVVELGSGAVNDRVTRRVADIPDGNYIVRYFAVSGQDEYAWPLHYDMTIGSHDYPTVLYTLSSVANFKKVYNGNVANSDYSTLKRANDHSVVFSLVDLSEDELVSSFRLWHNKGYRGSAIGLPIEVSFDDVDLVSDSVEEQVVGDRVVRTRESFPEMNWVTVGAFTNIAVTVPYWRDADGVTAEMALDPTVMRRRPTYLRVTGCTNQDNLWPLEFELRATTLPPGPEGTAQIDEVGSAFARVSGHIDTCGRGGGNCTVYLVATPMLGGKTVASVVAASVATETSFAGSGTGLSGSTLYNWQVVASNATSGTVLASGTFTTEESAGSLTPIVEFTSATAQADGTVLIGYNVTDAGAGCETADVYVRYGTDPNDLSGEVLVATGAIGERVTAVSGLPPGASLTLALVARNANGQESAATETRSCETVGPCGLEGAGIRPGATGCVVTVSGTLAPRGLGAVMVYLDYVSDACATTNSICAGAIAPGASADFAFETPLPRAMVITGMVRVVNSFGGVTWTNRSAGLSVPLGVRLPCNAVASGSAKQTAVMLAGRYGANYGPADLTFDLGAPRPITGVSFLVSDRQHSALNVMKDLKIEASLDGVIYETIFANDSRPFVIGGTYMSYAADAAHHGPYRYGRVSAKGCTSLLLSDVRLLSTGLAVEGVRPAFWNRDLEAGQTNEVSFSGRLLSAPTGTAHVYAVCAPRDMGDSLAAWQAGGAVVDLGTVGEGEMFSNTVAIATGTYCCRYYAVAGGTVDFSPTVFTFSSGTTSFAPSRIFIRDSTVANKIKAAYDGVAGSVVWYSTTEPFVMPLDELPAGHRLASVRVWVRPGYSGYLYDISADVSYDAVDLDTGSTAIQTQNNRTVRAVTAYPEMTWMPAGAFNVVGDAIDHAQSTGRYGVEFLLPRALCARHPKFLRVQYPGTTCSVAEIELRCVPVPGFAIIVK